VITLPEAEAQTVHQSTGNIKYRGLYTRVGQWLEIITEKEREIAFGKMTANFALIQHAKTTASCHTRIIRKSLCKVHKDDAEHLVKK
jgi:hypothetical protein